MSATVSGPAAGGVPASALPALERVLASQELAPIIAAHGRSRITAMLRKELADLREQALAGSLRASALTFQALAQALQRRLQAEDQPRLTAVYNLTGTVLHTNLGRALLPESAIQSVVRALGAPVNLEYDLESGGRGDRDALVEDLLCELTGAEAATVVNNNAAAVLLLLNGLANRREVVVSRGELVEIGGAFRIPDIMRRAGAKLVEIGTTNRTHAADYDNAVSARTALLMKVHCSNYAVSGFTHSVELAEVADIAHRHGLPAVVDLGSGTLTELERWGLPHETTVRETLQAGADLVSFSGDKLLGGPQAGMLVGRADLIRKLKKNSLKRALRVGKLTLAALEPVLALYRSPELLAASLPTLRLLTRPAAEMQVQSRRLLAPLQQALGADYTVADVPMHSQIGSGSLPVDLLPSYGWAISHAGPGRPGRALQKLEARLRALPRPVIGRLAHDALWLDLRCLEPQDEAPFMAQLAPAQA